MSRTGWYVPRVEEHIGNISAIKRHDNGEIEINSKYGFIYPKNENTYVVVITDYRRANKLLPKDKRPICKEDETMVVINKNELPYWIKSLGIRKNRPNMVKRAEEFGK